MSTLVINSASRVARGVIKELLKTSATQSVVCADLYPNYKAWERYITLGSEIPAHKSQIKDLRFEGKLDLTSAIASAKEIIYVTHDYYLNVPGKVNLFQATLELAKKHPQKRVISCLMQVVLITPSEYDHSEEKEPNYAGLLDESKHPNAINLRVDLTFDEDSQIVQNTILRRVSSSSSFYFDKRVQKSTRMPIKVSDVAKAAIAGLKRPELKGSYFLQGSKSYSYEDLIEILEKTANKKTIYNATKEEQWVSPAKFSTLSCKLYTTCYINSQGIIHSTRTGHDASAGSAADLLGSQQLEKLEDFYTEGRFVGMQAHGHSALKKFLFY